MKIGFISFPVPGHFNPMSALARQLQSRNQDVVMFSPPVGESLARAANLPFVPFGEKEFPAEHSSEVIGTVSRLKGEEGLRFTVNAIAAATEVKWRTLPNLLSSTGNASGDAIRHCVKRTSVRLFGVYTPLCL